jgi:hypothetical protein
MKKLSINPTLAGIIVIALIITVVAFTGLNCLNYTR